MTSLSLAASTPWTMLALRSNYRVKTNNLSRTASRGASISWTSDTWRAQKIVETRSTPTQPVLKNYSKRWAFKVGLKYSTRSTACGSTTMRRKATLQSLSCQCLQILKRRELWSNTLLLRSSSITLKPNRTISELKQDQEESKVQSTEQW